jgi:hypothetical protein
VKLTVSQTSAIKNEPGALGAALMTAFFIAIIPKCPLCWVALLSSIGLTSTIAFEWLQPLAAFLLLISLLALFVRAKRRAMYGPFVLGVIAAGSIYLFKFRLDYASGVYAGSIALFASSIWGNLPRNLTAIHTSDKNGDHDQYDCPQKCRQS